MKRISRSDLAPWLLRLTRRPAAGVGIDGPLAWTLGTLVVWLVTALAAWLLPPLFIRERAEDRRRG
ncbi:hypothetical protein [Microbacterium timonense]|uniref:hypothetical protein n=1 Tax=Microbacterium timonense TaxID=2086576 RepID=UPI000D10EACE|nr:hypothetical protein [Microbacterium timonense]